MKNLADKEEMLKVLDSNGNEAGGGRFHEVKFMQGNCFTMKLLYGLSIKTIKRFCFKKEA